jgi:hypothetical protein
MESPMVGTGMITFSHEGRVAVTYGLLEKSSDDDFVDIRRRIFIRPIIIMDAIIIVWSSSRQSELGPRPYSFIRFILGHTWAHIVNAISEFFIV